MRVLPFKIPESVAHSFRVQVDELEHFYDRFHHHPELQITFIEKSHGTLLLGNAISNFVEGDAFLIGANVPHSFRNHSSFYQNEKKEAKAISIFFNEKSLGPGFFDLPELKKVRGLLKAADRGIKINASLNAAIAQKMQAIILSEGIQRVLFLLEILEHIIHCDQIEYLSNFSLPTITEGKDSKKLEAIFQYILDHYERPVKLEEVAAVANLSVSAFCRFFKTRTRKTFSRYINEFRISVACKKLLQEDCTISEVCYQVGFSNLSNFNRQFKLITGYAPSVYIKTITTKA